MKSYSDKVYRVFGDRIMVSKIMSPPKTAMEKEQFKGEVLVLAVGDGAKDWGVVEGDKLLVSGQMDFNEDCYVHKNQIMRWI